MEEKKAKMLKFIMGKGHQHSAERLKVQKELFKFSRVSFHIFFFMFSVSSAHNGECLNFDNSLHGNQQ